MKKCLIAHEKQSCEFCLFCKVKINLSWREKVQAKAKLVPIETKQKILDLLHEGKKVGEAIEGAGLDDHDVGFEIIAQQIEHHTFNTMRTKAV